MSAMGVVKVFRRPAVALALVCLAGVMAACGDDESGGGSAAASPSQVSIPDTAPDPDKRCGSTDNGETVVLTAEDGTKLAAARYGTGSRAVVLLPQVGADLCGWSGFVPALTQKGLQVLAIDPRCQGYSNCPPDDEGTDSSGARDYAADAGAGIAELHRAGATKVAVMGASMGAATAFVAAGRYADQVSAVVALSLFNSSYAVSTSDIGSAMDAAPHVTAPILLCLSTSDSNSVQQAAAEGLIDAAPSKAAGSVVAIDGFLHGWDMLSDDTVRAKVLDFLTQHA
jgi:pimeloyl-ACP methyl ester carboxylesterase